MCGWIVSVSKHNPKLSLITLQLQHTQQVYNRYDLRLSYLMLVITLLVLSDNLSSNRIPDSPIKKILSLFA